MLRGTAEIALAVGAVANRYKMAKHFDLDITDTRFSHALALVIDGIAARTVLIDRGENIVLRERDVAM